MKTKNNCFAGLLIALLALFVVHTSKAQCPTIDNQLGCSIQVQITLYTNCSPGVTCGSPFTVNVPANTILPVTCPTTCSGIYCEIMVGLMQVNGSPVSPIFAKTITGPPGPSTTIPTGCGGTANLYYSGGNFVVQ